MNAQATVTQLQQFREGLYQILGPCRDAAIDLVDALSSNLTARSVVELSLSSLFRRTYSSITDAITYWFQASEPEKEEEERRAREKELARLIGGYLPSPQRRKFWLFGTDVVPIPRLYAEKLADRTFVYQPNVIRGNKPVTIGHAYSAQVFFPEKLHRDAPPWVVPMIMHRVHSTEKATVVGAEQMATLMEDETQPFHRALCVHVGDCVYSSVQFLGRVGHYRQLVNISRAASNRVFYRQFQAEPGAKKPGHPRWYGDRFSLKESTTWGSPDETAETTFTTKKGQTYRVQLQGWHNLLMRGKKGLPMHRYPFTLVRAVVLDEQDKQVFKRAMWLIVMGERRGELSLVEIWDAYAQRYDIEHYFRFGKQRLLMAAYQTPEVAHEENWLQIVQVVTVQLWLARELANVQLRKWERYLPKRKDGTTSPSQVQRDFERIIRQVGTPARAPKRRGKSPGRTKGTRPPHRQRHPVIKKHRKTRKKAA